MNRLALGMCVVVVLFAVAVCLGGKRTLLACPETNTCEGSWDNRHVNSPDGSFYFDLYFEWHLTGAASWVTAQVYSGGASSNVQDVTYTPSFLQNQACEDDTTFFVQGKLVNKFQDGVVDSQLDAGITPHHCGDYVATFIPHV